MAAHASRLLEVIVISIQEAISAEQGGADRLEVVRDLRAGGLTPSIALVRQIRRSVTIPIRVMLREHDDFAAGDRGELESLKASALEFADAGVDGLVLGFLREQRVDVESISTVLDGLKGMKATFHHAFDAVSDPAITIDVLKNCRGIDRILTSGGQGKWQDKTERLTGYVKRTRPNITIMAGGGLDLSAVQMLLTQTQVREFHVGRAVRNPLRVNGALQSRRVAELAEKIHSKEAPGATT
ncbi:MAG: copper homeostasis protein CutC [Candidatus Acidiferrales bacterium]